MTWAEWMTNDIITVVIVDDHDGIRAGIKGLLTREDDIEVVAEGANGQEAVDLAREKTPDVMLLDVELPIMRGEEVVKRIRKEHSPVKVLAVSSYDDRQYIHGMLDNGAQGYITKEEASEFLVEAVRKIAEGERKWLSPRAARDIPSQPLQTAQTMTKREFEILQLLSHGRSRDEITRSMGMVSERFNNYVQVLMVKYGVDSLERLRQIAKKIFANDLKS